MIKFKKDFPLPMPDKDETILNNSGCFSLKMSA